MDKHVLSIALMLAYGPFLATLALYLVALALRWAGRPSLLSALVERTKTPQPIHRDQVDGII